MYSTLINNPTLQQQLVELAKTLEAGSYNVAPSQLVQGAALQTEDLSIGYEALIYSSESIAHIQRHVKVSKAKSQLVQFNRKITLGDFKFLTRKEGVAGRTNVSEYARYTVPMCYFSEIRGVSYALLHAETAIPDIEAEIIKDATASIATAVEYNIFQGSAHFNSNGYYTGNPSAFMHANLTEMHGIDVQVRQSDDLAIAQNLMFKEFGSTKSAVIDVSGDLSQSAIENAKARAAIIGRDLPSSANTLYLSPIVLANYNKIAFQKERIILAGSPQEASGAQLRSQFTSNGTVNLVAHRLLSGKVDVSVATTTLNAPTLNAPTVASGDSKLSVGSYIYFVTACDEMGESAPSATVTATVAAVGDFVTLTWAPVVGASYYNVYRTVVGGNLTTAGFIGRVAQSATPTFVDRGYRLPGFSNGYLIAHDSMELKELAPFSRIDAAITTLIKPILFYRFVTLAVPVPRLNVILDNLKDYESA